MMDTYFYSNFNIFKELTLILRINKIKIVAILYQIIYFFINVNAISFDGGRKCINLF